MSIIDEIIAKEADHPENCILDLDRLSDELVVPVSALEALRPYVELGEMVANSKLVDTKGPKGVLRLTLEFEHTEGITLVKLLQQIREQENG